MARSVLGLDIGGANLKAAHSDGTARLVPFELWKAPSALPDALHDLLATMPAFQQLAITMTGELCDCFETRREGVLHILKAVDTVAGHMPVRVWLTDGRFVELDAARQTPLLAASSNWLALATFAGRFAPHGAALLIDVGSTTTDLVPLREGLPVPQGRPDAERLASGELVYTGIRRTPVCALHYGDLMAELFATTLDVYLVLGSIPENPYDCETADGRPATRACARARLARMRGEDLGSFPEELIREFAEDLSWCQFVLIRQKLEMVTSDLIGPIETVILSGSGEFLGRDVIEGLTVTRGVQVVSLTETLGPEVSQAACAYALATLAAERDED